MNLVEKITVPIMQDDCVEAEWLCEVMSILSRQVRDSGGEQDVAVGPRRARSVWGTLPHRH